MVDDLELAAAHAEHLAEAALMRRGTAGALKREDVKQLNADLALLAKGVSDAVQHVALMVGYRDGFAARTEARDRLWQQMGEPKRLRTADAWLEHIAKGATLVAEALRKLAEAPPPEEPPADHPQKPGPRATAARAVEHLASLVSRLELTIQHHVPLQ